MPADLIQRLTLHGGVIPGFLALVLLAGFWLRHRIGRRAGLAPGGNDAPGEGPLWLLPVLIALGFAASFWVVNQSLDFWPIDNTKRAVHAVLLFAVLGVAEGLVRIPQWIAVAPRALVYGLATWMLTEGYAPQTISTPEMWGYVALAALGGALIARGVEASFTGTRGWTGPAAALVLIGGVQPVLHFAGFSSGSLALAGAIAVLSSAAIVSVFAPAFSLTRGTVTVLVGLVLVSVLGAGVQSEPKSAPGLLLLALAPLGLTVATNHRLGTLALRASLTGAMAAAALAVVLWTDRDSKPAPGGDAYDSYYGG
jgi:hypothetical protein